MGSRIDERELAEFRLRLRASLGRWDERRLSAEDVEALLDEVAECWAGNLPKWANGEPKDELCPAPMAHIAAIEELAERAMNKAKTLGEQKRCATAEEWNDLVHDIFNVLEDLEDGEEVHTEEREERRCADVDVACGGPSHSPCAAGRHPTR